MSVVIALRCDQCGQVTLDDQHHSSIAEARTAARRKQWQRRAFNRQHVDLCPTCWKALLP